jgi:prepilin-type N-terminal cleavage/methylation domain-containing protein
MNRHIKQLRTRGFTLVELMVSLCIFSLMSTAIASLMFYAYDTSRYSRSENQLVQQVESAMRRIIDNTRSASTPGPEFSASVDGDPTPPKIDLSSQSDPDNANVKYEIKYYVQYGTLFEDGDRLYGVNPLVTGVTDFNVKVIQSTPTVLKVTITAVDGTNTVSRTCHITARNF